MKKKRIDRKSRKDKTLKIKELVEWKIKAESNQIVWHFSLEAGGNSILKGCQSFCQKSISWSLSWFQRQYGERISRPISNSLIWNIYWLEKNTISLNFNKH